MPDNFITTRTPGSRTSTYGLADHIADSDPHPQYLLKTEYASDGVITDGKLDAHMTDPNAHAGVLATVQQLNNYVLKSEFTSILASNLYHDYANDSSTSHAASMAAVNGAYGAALSRITDHIKPYAQNATVTAHRDSENQELYAHRVHTHSLNDLGGIDGLVNDLDNRYSKIGHRHDDLYAPIIHDHPGYLTQSDLESVGVYPNTTIGTSTNSSDGTLDPLDFNDKTQQGNISISSTVMSTALHGPSITAPSMTSFLNVVTEVTQADGTTEEGNDFYGERYCSQTLTTDDGIYYRIGHRLYALESEGVAEEALWTWGDWTPVGGGARNIFEVFYSTTTDTPRGAFPLWTGEKIDNCKTAYPTFWARALEYQTSGKIRVVTSTVYDQELATYGECGAFVIDTDAGSIRLPKITRFVSSLDAISDIGVTKNDQILAHTHSTPNGSLFVRPDTIGGGGGGDHWHHNDDGSNVTGSTGGSENLPKHVRLALYIQVFNTITPSATTDLEARVGVLESNAIMFARHDFTAATSSSGWVQNSDGLYEYTFRTNHFTSSHIYMIESGGSVLVDESVEVHIVGETTAENVDRDIKLVAPQPFAGYIITLG